MIAFCKLVYPQFLIYYFKYIVIIMYVSVYLWNAVDTILSSYEFLLSCKLKSEINITIILNFLT